MENTTKTTETAIDRNLLLATVFNEAEKFRHSIFIQKLSSTTFTKDCNDLDYENMPSHFGLENGFSNIWRVKLGRSGKWNYLKSMIEVSNWLSQNCC